MTTLTQDWRLDVRLVSHQALAQYMNFRNFTVRSLAMRTGVHRSEIGHLRSGKRTNCAPEKAQKIAEALDCPVESLFVPRLLHVSRTKPNTPTK